ncbi:MAG: trimethylamine methyltransferase family protein [Verrucomicrobia bacterium]|nr:trimethylamine methyltransferase family protein [Verrucomicrobiota bacterium]
MNLSSYEQPMMRFASERQLDEIHDASLEVLERTGIRVMHPEATTLLRGAGAWVDATDDAQARVRIPAALVERAIQSSPSRVVLASRDGRRSLALERDRIYFGTGSDLKHTIDLETGERRLSVLEDVARAARVCEQLPNIDFVMSYALALDVPAGLQELAHYEAMLRHTTKPLLLTTFSNADVLPHLYRIAATVAGGETEFQRSPTFALYGQFVSPFCHDRIPRFDSYWPETIQRWQDEGLAGDADTVLDLLRSDITRVCSSLPVPFPGREEVLSEDEHTKVVRGNQGKTERVWKHRSGTPEHIRFDCDCREKWEREYQPALLSAGLTFKLDEARRNLAQGWTREKFCVFMGVEPFEDMRQLVGDELLLPAMAENPDWVRDMSRTYADLILRDFHAVLDSGAQPDAVWLFGDLGYKSGPFFSPRMYRELIWPDHRRLCDWTHAHGMKFIYHTDGDVRKLLDLFVEAGFDCLQPLEAKAHMDVRDLAPRYGQRLSFFGNIDMTVVIGGDRGQIEHEVRTKLAAGMAYRGYAYHSDHSVPPQVDWETYKFLIELLDRHGNYGITSPLHEP